LFLYPIEPTEPTVILTTFISHYFGETRYKTGKADLYDFIGQQI